jgi:hypothetical protein
LQLKLVKQNVAKVTAAFGGIDLITRVASPEGNTFDLKFGEKVKNLPQVKGQTR